MPESTIVPPVPTINQGDSPEQIKAAVDNVQAIFDRVAPSPKGMPKAPVSEPAPPPPAEPPKEEPAPEPPPPESKEPAKEPEKEPSEPKLPSFIEKALEMEPGQAPEPAPAADEWPEELPGAKTEDAKNNWKKFRAEYKTLKEEIKTLRERPTGTDPATSERLTFLENQNKELGTLLNRYSVETHQDFQQKIIRPMVGAWNEAARIVKDAGGDPVDLQKAMALSGKAHFDALDAIFEGMPESAKIEANDAIRTYRRFDEARRAALAEAPKTIENLRKADMARHQQVIAKQREEMSTAFDSAIKKLKESGLEVLQRSDDPDAGWWNEQAQKIESTTKKFYMENADMERLALACAAAGTAEVYRQLWIKERNARMKNDKALKSQMASEPNLSESGGANPPASTLESDLKKPFKDVFLREFHKQRSQGVQ